MARFQFSRRGVAPQSRAHAVVSAHSLRALRLQDTDDETAQGPGWCASSWELVRGLEVHEASSSEERLYDWLDAVRFGASGPDTTPGPPECLAAPEAIPGPATLRGAPADVGPPGTADPVAEVETAQPDAFSRFGIDDLELL
jgi:hypothetical protein